MKTTIAAFAILTAISGPVIAGETAGNADASVYFVNLADGDTVSSPVKVVFGLSGMGVAPAGTEVDITGHHHLFIDRPALGEGAEDAELLENGIPSDEHHVHFGKGQTETSVDLTPGAHSLQLVLGDLYHVPHSDPVTSQVISITVE